MVIECPKCGARSNVEERDFGGNASLELKCGKCQHRFSIGFPTRLASAYGAAAKAAPARAPEPVPLEEIQGELPAGKTVTISLLAGPMQGPVIPIDKPSITIGRSGTDILIADPEVSRHHCLLVIAGEDGAVLSDLGSTNGTFVGEERISILKVSAGTKFRVGASVLTFALADKDS